MQSSDDPEKTERKERRNLMSTQKRVPMIKKTLVTLLTIMLTLVFMLSIVAPVMAQANRIAPDKNVPVTLSLAPGPTDPAELESFLDELFAQQMQEHHIAGAAVSVVKDGRLFFAKGYGYADIEQGVPVDPEQTIFRIGSVGKLFTWTAVMQLVEQGKLDLDADINTYLDFRIPDTYPQPVTLKHLLTHTSGFEDRWFGSAVSDAQDQVPARAWLVSHMWARVNPPGVYARYSNFNAVLAGYIVAQVSGQPYDQYIQEHILDPLGMSHSTAQSPIPQDLRPYASLGYTYADGAFQAFPEYAAQPAGLPSGAHQASVTDMARFMIAHLENGRYSDATIGEARILKEKTAQQMHSTLYTPDPRLHGTAYGFFDWSDNGQWTLGHQGYSPPMNSVLLLLPDQHLGVYVNYNSEDVGDLTVQHFGFQRAFFDHYFPASAAASIQPPADFAERAGRFVGSYNTIHPSTTLVKISGLFGGGYPVEISDPGDGTLLFTMMGNDWRFVEVEPLYFRQADGPYSLMFREDDKGRITHMFTDLMPQYAELKLDWYATPGFNMALLQVCLLVFLFTIPVAAVSLIRNRHPSTAPKPASRGARTAHWIILGLSILNLLFLAGLMWGVMRGTSNILLDPSLIIKIDLGLGFLSAVLTVGALVYTVLAWKNSYWGIVGRAYYTLVTIAAVAFVWFMNYWNLLGWRY
jgi:CubicO group peptidase (beta-lactamase class C family)